MSAAGGFATVLVTGERDAGTILVICCENGSNERLFERMPDLEGNRSWTLIRKQHPENPGEFSDYLERRKQQDRDLWIVELDIAHAERFIGLT